MSLFDDFIKAVQNKTAWRDVKLNVEKHTCFELLTKDKESISLELFSPEGQTLIMQVKLELLPIEENLKSEMLKEYAKRQVAACKKRASILSIDKNYIMLYRKERMHDMEKHLESLNDFLKDVDWWMQKDTTSPNQFNFSMSSWGK